MNHTLTVAPLHRADVWAAGEAYEPYVGRWSRLVARDFIDWLALQSGGRWLDVGCGTGALTEVIAARAEPSILCLDPSGRFIALARRHVQDRRIIFQTGDAQTLPFPDMTFDGVVAGLVLNFVADISNPMLKDRIAELKAIRDRARADAERAEGCNRSARAEHHTAGAQDVRQAGPQADAD